MLLQRASALVLFVGFWSALTMPVQSQEIADYTALGESAFAQRLQLSDQQVAEVTKILAERRAAIIEAEPSNRASIFADANLKLAEILTASQKQRFAELVVGGKLRFSFQDESWSEVLNWFAGQAGLALVMDETPPGNFTYNDTKNHTPSEAIDLLNSVLQSKGFTLVRRDKMLIVSRTNQGVPYDQVPKVSPEELAERGRFEYVSVLFPLEGRPVESVATEVSAFLGTNGKATPLPATGQLLVVDTAGRVEAIRKLIESIPKPKKKEDKSQAKPEEKPKPPPPVFQVHAASGLDIGQAIETLKILYPDARLTGDGKAEQITAFTPQNNQDAIAKTLAQMTANVTGENEPRLEIYSIVGQNLERLQIVLEQANPGIQVSADVDGNRLLIVGDAAQHAGVQQTLETMDAVVADDSALGEVAVYDVDPELANQLVELLQPLIPRASVVRNAGRIAVRGTPRDQQIAKSAIEQLDAAEESLEKPALRFLTLERPLAQQYLDSVKQIAPRARVSEVSGRRQLAIVATEADYERIRVAVSRVETELAQQQVQMQQFDVKVDDPRRLLTLLKEEFPDRQMLLNQEQDALLVWALPEEAAQLQTKFDELSAILPAKRESQWRSYSSGNIDLDDMQALLKPVVRAAEFKPEPQRKRMLVWATGDEHQKIEETLEAFQGANPAEYEAILLAYPLNRGDPASVVSMLQGMRPDVRFAADERANRILVTAPLSDQRKIQAIIEQLDVAPDRPLGDIARSYDIKSMSPSALIQLLQPTLGKMRMTANDQQGKLAAVGPEFEHAKIQAALEQLDGEGKQGKVVSYNVGNTDPRQVRSILQQLVPGVIVTVNSDSRSIIVWASEKDHDKIQQAVEQFTKEGESQSTTEIYRFDRTDNRAAERVFEEMAPNARISRIYGTNSVIATATAEEHALLREAAEKMNGGESETVTKVYPIDKKQLNVDDVLASIDDTLKSRLAIRMNEQTNSLMVRGSPEDQATMQQLIKEIAEQVPSPEKRLAKIYELQHADPDTAVFILRDLYPQARFTEDDETGSVAAMALAEEHQEIENVLKQLDVPGQQSRQTTEIYRFDRASGRAVENAFERLAPRARVSFVYGTNSVIATATEAEHALFREAAAKMNGSGGQSITRVYPLDKKQIDVEDVLESIDDTLRSRLAIRLNEQTNSILVRGSSEDQATMQELIDQIVSQIPPKESQVARVYRLKYGSPRSARYALRDLFEDATIAYDDDSRTLIATATEEQHQRIASVIEQMDQPGTSGKQTRVYQLNTAQAGRVYPAISELVEDGRVSYDSEANVIIVTTNETEHESVAQAIQDLNDSAGDADRTTRVYSLKTANPSNIQNSIERLMPRVRVASDAASGSLIVSGRDEDHQRVAELVKQLEVAPGQEAVMRAYVIQSADGQQVYQSLANTFNGNGNFSLSWQEATKTIFVVATPKNHAIFSDLIRQLDDPELADVQRTAKTYPLTNLSGSAGRTAITALLKGTSPAPSVELDELGNSLIVVGTDEQHSRVSGTLAELSGAAADLEVFELDYVDPWTVESAIDSLFSSLPVASSPTVTSDYTSQRLFVRGTKSQIEQIRGLLRKLGERSGGLATASGSGDVRTIPFRGDVNEAMRNIREVWPRIRKNRIQVVAPSEPTLRINESSRSNSKGGGKFTPTAPAGKTVPLPTEKSFNLPEDATDDSVLSIPAKGNRIRVEVESPEIGSADAIRFVALQTSTKAPVAESDSQESSEDSPSDVQELIGDDQVDEVDRGDVTESDRVTPPADAPVVIVPESDRITIASSDREALDQLEELLRVMSRAESDESNPGADFAVFLLRNTGASDMRQLLGELFEQLRKSQAGSGGRPGSSSFGSGGSFGFSGMSSLLGPNFGNVAVVADDRLNALIIHGDRQERELIEELLRVLDTEDLPNPIVVYQPELVRLTNTQAQRVLEILKNVYRSQLQSGGGRKKVDVPEGVSSEVASVLQQINAAAGAPILTLDVDETTNSIVMRAPPELRQEITAFVHKLDEGAGANRSRNVRVIRIQQGKSDRIRDALQQFILDRNGR